MRPLQGTPSSTAVCTCPRNGPTIASGAARRGPGEIAFATKPELATTMLEAARAAYVPFSWVLADAGYGCDPQLPTWCHERTVPYVFALPVDLPLDGPAGKPRRPAVKRADDLLHDAKFRDQWKRRSCGDGAKGERNLRLDRLRRAGQRRGAGRVLHTLAGASTATSPHACWPPRTQAGHRIRSCCRPGKSLEHQRERGQWLIPGPLLRPSVHTIRCLAATQLNPHHPVETVLTRELWCPSAPDPGHGQPPPAPR